MWFIWPRTLLWRTFLLIVLLIGLSLAAWFQIYSHYALLPRAQQTAQMVVSVVNLTRSALLASDSTQRLNLLRELSRLEGIRIYPAEADDAVEPLPDTGFLNTLSTTLRTRLGNDTRLGSKLSGEEGFFISFRLDPTIADDQYWVMLPPERINRNQAAGWLGWGFAAALMSLLGAYFLVLSVTRPLKGLEKAAKQVGRGELPEHALPEDGPREVVSVARAFNQMSRDLAQLESDRALILASVSHDLRTPLARLRLGIELSGAQTEDVTAMSGDIEEMDRIINQFLDFAREANSEPETLCDVNELVTEVLNGYVRRGEAVADTRAGGIETVVPVRPMALRRALTNLIDNALRYAGTSAPIDVGILNESGFLTIEVSDRGPGIAAHEVERLKRPFTRLESARTNVQGSGLGLAIVERIARAHGGRLDLRAREGGGLAARIIIATDRNLQR